ncbi:nucleotidyltransferase domain-containing protein [Dokdonia sp. PRO95]|uniref:nucleotidyltransferase domain-containing protein n=1 Tax=Dokdonia sp. PRO95 TaxID=1239415 RepID=UPI0005505E84|nr:nucleotidyltransferase domain-containing protein [Dokdonia sp. PRO95]
MIDLNIKRKEHFDLYLFGSSLYSDTPSDIDIAIIYDKKFIDIKQALNYRSEILIYLNTELEIKIDTILLSKEEEIETEFLSNAKHKKL